MPDDNRKQGPSNNVPRDPLDDLLTDADLQAESRKVETPSTTAKRRSGKRSRFRAFLIATLVVLTGFLIAERFELRKRFKLPVQKLASKELFDRASPAVVRVNVCNSRSQPIGHGSGFFVRDDSTVVTNYHVIAGAHSAEVILKDGTTIPVKGVVAFNESSDVAVLSVERVTTSHTRHLDLGSKELPSVGEHVYVIGSPKGYDYTLSDGMVSGHSERDGRKWIQMTAPVSHGSSGSPVLGDDGSVLGIATWVDWSGQNLNFASPTRTIASLLDGESKFQSLPDLIAGLKQLLSWPREELENGNEAVAAGLLISLSKSCHELPEFWVLRGHLYYRQREFVAAISAYSKAVTLDAQDSEVWWRIGSAHHVLSLDRRKLGEEAVKHHREEALRAYRKGTEINPSDDKCWDGLGWSFLEAKRPQDAAVALRRCLAINPKSNLTHSRLAEALGELGDVEGAIAEYKAESDLASEMIDVYGASWVAQPNYDLGCFLQKCGRHKEAIVAFEKALTLFAKDVDQQRQKWCEEAITESRRIESLKKSN